MAKRDGAAAEAGAETSGATEAKADGKRASAGRGTGRKRGAAKGKGTVGAKPSLATRRAAFLKELRGSLNVSAAARKAGIGNSTVYRHRQANARFRAAWDAAMTEALDDVESNILRRAIEGVEKPVFYRGAQVGSVRTYSDTLAMFILKAKRPEVYARLIGAAPTPSDMTEEEARAEVQRRLDRLAEAEA